MARFVESGLTMQRNVLFILVDCLRADILWDRQRYASLPSIDSLLARSTAFTNTIAAATTTTPSVATILTGRYPSEHGIRSLLGYKLQPNVRTLPEVLRERGYHTVAEVTGPLFPLTGLDRGFDVYNRRERHSYLDTSWGERVISSLDGGLPEPWFMFLHLWELHWPRRATGEFASARYGNQLYQRSVAYLDSQLPRILDVVDPERALVVMTGDHGEGIAGAIDDPRPWVQLAIRAGYRVTRGLPARTKKRILSLGKRAVLQERNQKEVAGHAALCVYDYLIRVPLIFSAPGAIPEGRKLDTQVRHIDIAPTILDTLGIDPTLLAPQPSLLAAMHDEDKQDRLAITEALQTMLHDQVNRLVGLRTGRFKYITAPDDPSVASELYDLKDDPGERNNLATEQPGLLEELRQQLTALQAGGDDKDRIQDQRMSPEEEEMVRQRLEALGYLE